MRYQLCDIVDRLGVDARRLRYLLEQQTLPRLGNINTGRGNHRKLTTRQARLVGLAALLYDLGLRGPALKKTIKKLSPVVIQEEYECQVPLTDEPGIIYSFVTIRLLELYERIP